MKNEFDFTGAAEFDGKTAEGMLNDFLDSCPVVSDDVYANLYGACFPAMSKILPKSFTVFLWMLFNCELNNGRIIIQSLAQKRLLKECGIPQVTYFNCLRDLKRNNMIRGFRAVYYINPKFAWRGTHKHRQMFIEQYPYIQNERVLKNDMKND